MKLSIVTINYNNAEGLKKTLASVASQQFSSTSASLFTLEHIIVDGASTDGSVDVIRDYSTVHHTPYTIHWISEPDKGIYNAMNKGIRMATGDYIQILNSGDILASNDVLARLFDAIKPYTVQSAPDILIPDLFYGNMVRVREDGTIEGKSGCIEYSLLNFYSGTLNHDCCWIRSSLFVPSNKQSSISNRPCYGLYDENLKIVSDWKWFLQAIALGHVKPVYVDIDMTIFDTTGISERNLELRKAERRKVLEEVLPSAVLADYDKHAFDMQQMDNLRKHPWAYKLVWTLERVLNRLDNKNFKKPKK